MIFISLLLNSCTSDKKTSTNEGIGLFNDYVFSIENKEQLTILDTALINEFNKKWDDQAIKVPLFKHIKHKEYELYLGIPFNTSIEQAWLMKSVLNKEKHQLLKSDSSTYVYSVTAHDSIFSYELFLVKEGNLFYVLAESKKQVLNVRFSRQELAARFTKKSIQ